MNQLDIDGAIAAYDPTRLHAAINALAIRCDGAHELDGQGFDGTDTHFGKRIAAIPADLWSEGMILDAYTVARKYRSQLESYGCPVDDIPVPPGWKPPSDQRRQSKDEVRKVGGRATTKIEVANGLILVTGPYDAERVSLSRKIPGRRWNGRHDTFPLSSARAVVEMADKLGCPIPDELRGIADQQDETPMPSTASRRVRVEGERLVLLFDYDPDLVAQCRELPGASWDKLGRRWMCDPSVEAINWANRNQFEIDQDVVEQLTEAVEARRSAIEESSAADADLPDWLTERLGITLRPFQRAGVRYAMKKKRVIIGDEMGLGKTFQALAALEANNSFPALCVVPAGVKENWRKEAARILPHRDVQVIYGRKPMEFNGEIVIINYDIVPNRDGKGHEKRLLAREWKGLVLDESHDYVSSPKLRRTKLLTELAGDVRARDDHTIACITGTAIRNRLPGLIPQLRIVGRIDDLGGEKKVYWRYVKEATRDGFNQQRMLELHERLRASCYIRRVKTDVAKELPEKERTHLWLPTTEADLREYRKAERDLIEHVRARARERALAAGEDPDAAAMEAAIRVSGVEHLVKVNYLRQLVAKARLPYMFDWVDEFLESTDRKLVVAGWHTEIVRPFADRYGGLRISGDITGPKRETMIERFQNGPERVIAVQIKSGGVGITLTAASDMLMAEQTWTASGRDQMEDRIHRIGQENHCSIHYAMAEGTIDPTMYDTVHEKAKLAAAVHDGKLLDADELNSVEAGDSAFLDTLVAMVRRNP